MMKNFEFFNSILNQAKNFNPIVQNQGLLDKKWSQSKINPIKIPTTPKNNGPFSHRIERINNDQRALSNKKNNSFSKKKEVYTKKLKEFFPFALNRSIADLLNDKQRLNLTNIAFYNMYSKYETRKNSESK